MYAKPYYIVIIRMNGKHKAKPGIKSHKKGLDNKKRRLLPPVSFICRVFRNIPVPSGYCQTESARPSYHFE